jgi:folate-dependent phosphoribosylglycinamide formyltransferase PurN
MRTVLICHEGDPFDEPGLPLWLGSFSDLVGIIKIDEPNRHLWKRICREWHRSGFVGFLDVLAFRAYYRARLANADRNWHRQVLEELRAAYPQGRPAEVLRTRSPNSAEAEGFLRRLAPDLVVARCKTLLRKGVFDIPRLGTFVMHPGICPEYRNAHGCFWALAQDDRGHVGMTLLRIDEGIDTGPIFGHYTCEFDARRDSHIKIQAKALIDNLDALRSKLTEIAAGTAPVVDVRGRPSREWGQPRLSAYLRWRRAARKEATRHA